MTVSLNSKFTKVPDHVPAECVVDWDFQNVPGADKDVYEAWKKLQDGPPVQWTPHYGGHWIVTRARLIQEVQLDHSHFSHREFSLPRGTSPHLPPIDLDPPEHTPVRRILNICFAPAVIHRLKQQIRELAIELTEGLKDQGHCDFVTDYARRFPIVVFLRLVDLPLSRREEFLAWAEATARGTAEQKQAAFANAANFLRDIVQERFENPGTDVISQMLSSEVGGRRVTIEEGMGMTTLLFFGGLDTVASMLGFIARFLATHPEHRRYLTENPDKIPSATEELLRRFGLSNTIRIITEDYDFHGYPLKKDEAIMVPISLASMDEEYWENAMEVDFDRKFKTMDTFGNGPHKCPGSNLARSEIQIFLEEWLKRIPEFSIAEGRQATTASGSVPCVTSLPLEWPAA